MSGVTTRGGRGWWAPLSLGVAIAVSGALGGACAEDSDPSQLEGVDHLGAARSGERGQATDLIQPFRDDEMVGWLMQECRGCHGVGDDDVTAPFASSWAMSKAFTVRDLQVSSLTPVVYQTIYNAFRNQVDGKKERAPSAMPLEPRSGDPAYEKDIARALAWFFSNTPYYVSEADARYRNEPLTNIRGIEARFVCKNRSTRRQFLTHFATGAFDRLPRLDEVETFFPGVPDAALDQPIGDEERARIVATLRTTSRTEFEQRGLRKLADFWVGTADITSQPDLSEPQVLDLKQEFYRSLLRHMDDRELVDYFKSRSVAVSTNTASLYEGCTFDSTRAVDGWSECEQVAPRGGLFTTFGFLNAKKSSVLESNNNYGRVAYMYFILFGDPLKPDTNGPAGEGPKPLPDCLESTDTRRDGDAVMGAAAVATHGEVCQTCHVSRSMAAGSVIFRPFSTHGFLYDAATFGEEAMPNDRDPFAQASRDGRWKFDVVASDAPRSEVEMKSFLKGLLDASLGPDKKACIATGDPELPYKPVQSVGDFASYYIDRSPAAIARGFARHATRAFANLPQATFEVTLAVQKRFDDGVIAKKPATLADLVEAYFSSQTFACEADGS